MPELVLIKLPGRYDWSHASIWADLVVGIREANSATQLEYGYELSGKETEEVLKLDDITAARMSSFFTQCKVSPGVFQPYYDCHIFVSFVLGMITPSISYYKGTPAVEAVPGHHQYLKEGSPYAIVDERARAVHSLLGLGRPDHSVSVTGKRDRLMVTPNTELLHLYSYYGGCHIRRAIHHPS